MGLQMITIINIKCHFIFCATGITVYFYIFDTLWATINYSRKNG